MIKPKKHTVDTKKLANRLKPEDVFNWLVSYGYYPESYILPPCFHVEKHPQFGKIFFPISKKTNKIKPTISKAYDLHFPKSELTDRTFGIINPEIHNDIAFEIANNWQTITDLLFDKKKQVYSYSFPIPLNSKTPGKLGRLRAGRMIYEWIAMAENDLAEEAYSYKYIIETDIKNFYPSIYTHSISWAIHTKPIARKNRGDHNYLGNRLDKLFQNANDGCTNGIPIGPVVSDLIAEIILSAVDLKISPLLKKRKILCVRFKDDYRFLCKDKRSCREAIKSLQRELKEFSLLLNEGKTEVKDLPEGIFRPWVSKYREIEPRRKKHLNFKEFREFYLGVLRIDKEIPGTGIVDRFLADLSDKNYQPLVPLTSRHIQKTISLLLMLAERRIKAFPKILGLLEAMMEVYKLSNFRKSIERHLNNQLMDLCKDEEDNRYLIAWILYFMESNKLKIGKKLKFKDGILKTIFANKNLLFTSCKDFTIYRGIHKSKRAKTLIEYLDTFKAQ